MCSSVPPDPTTISMFQQQWRVYRIMVEENYLFHREVYARLHQVLAGIGKPFRFLDIGCGDATYSAQALKQTSVAAYHGIDLSPEALEFARTTLRALHCDVTLKVGNYADVLRIYTDPADVIWIGLSLHHCRHMEKEAVLKDIRRVLVPGGTLLFYENTSPDGESRDEWLARWDLQRPAWSAYTEDEWNAMCDHVHAADFPETCSAWDQLAKATGFEEIRTIFAAPTDLFRMYALQ
jgi:SAM-dependent methyltransferase